MPEADSEITATYTDDPNYVPSARGYSARACGFDMDHDGTLGEGDDSNVGDGVTADPDGDGTDEDLIYVDATDGNDPTGDGSAGNPYKTVQYAMNQADGPGDGAEDIVCIAGTFNEALTLTQSGVAGYYTRDNFQFPNNPAMLIGWDTDNDGEYPPYDADDTAILDGNIDGNNLAIAIRTASGAQSYLEIAHLTVRNYGSNAHTTCGAFKLFDSGNTETHVYVHDVEMRAVNKGVDNASARIVFSFWGGPMQHVAVINNLVDEFASYFCRGAPSDTSEYFRFQNNTLTMYGPAGASFVHAWKLWGRHHYVEILDNIVDGNPEPYSPTRQVTGPGVCQGSQDWTIRNNEFVDLWVSVSVQGTATGYEQGRTVHNILIDRNIIRQTYTGYEINCKGINVSGGSDPNETTEDITITNNFISSVSDIGLYVGIHSGAGNDSGPQPGTITIAGNTIYGLAWMNQWTGPCYGIKIATTKAYPQNGFVIKNNIVTKMNDANENYNVEVTYAPTSFVANGNIYSDDGEWIWDGNVCATLSDWQTASGQDANSQTGDPLFVDDANGDLHIHPNDTLVEGAGVDITDITTVDIDGDARPSSTPWPGADVGVEANVPENNPPTAVDDSYETDVNTELNVDANNGVLANDSDPESDPLTAILVTDVSNGTLTLYSTGAFEYTPDANFVGEDMFVYKANDGELDSGDANVVITVSAPTDDYASAESTDRGTVDGNYTDTYSSDDSYEALTEVVQANRSKLEHEWTFSVTGGTSVQFSVEAYKAGTEDDFKFEYSPNGSDWTYMLTVSKTSDDNTPQTFDLPGGTSGTFYIHVLDTNRDNKAKDLDTVYVDHMFIRSQ